MWLHASAGQRCPCFVLLAWWHWAGGYVLFEAVTIHHRNRMLTKLDMSRNDLTKATRNMGAVTQPSACRPSACRLRVGCPTATHFESLLSIAYRLGPSALGPWMAFMNVMQIRFLARSVRKHRNLRLLAVETALLPIDDLKGAVLQCTLPAKPAL